MSGISYDIDPVDIFILAIFHSKSGRKLQANYLFKLKKYRTAKCYTLFHFLNEELHAHAYSLE